MKYDDQLKDEKWFLVREKVYENARYRCQLCGVSAQYLRRELGQSLEAHHSYYEMGKKAWEYPMSSMVALCKLCHSKIPHRERFVEKAVSAALVPVNFELERVSSDLNDTANALAESNQLREELESSSAIKVHGYKQYLAYAIFHLLGGELKIPVSEIDICTENYLISQTYDGSTDSINFSSRHIYDGNSAFGVRISSRSNDHRTINQILDFVKLLKNEDLHRYVEAAEHDSKFNSTTITTVNCEQEDQIAKRIFSLAYQTIECFEWFGSVQGKSP